MIPTTSEQLGEKPVDPQWRPETRESAPQAQLAELVARFKRAVRDADRDALGPGERAMSDAQVQRVRDAFRQLEMGFDALMRAPCVAGAEGVREQLGAEAQIELLPYAMLSAIGERWYTKPRGYAGDFLSIARMYEDAASGHGRLGAVLDRCFLDLAASVAVKNRRALVCEEILNTLAACGGRPARVTSLACGPATEVFDAFDRLADPAQLSATLVDNDFQALAYVSDRQEARGLRRRVELVHENLVHLATGRRTLALEPQDLIYSVGLIDYFDDAFVVMLLDWVHGTLRPGGRVMLGNFHPSNPTRAVMDHVLDWRLHHRDEDDMHRLVASSNFGTSCTRIVYEPQRINLFAEAIKL